MSSQAYLDNIKAITGNTADDFKRLAQKKGLLVPAVTAGTITAWLQNDFGLGHGHAMAIYSLIKSDEATPDEDDEKTGEIPNTLSKPAQRALAAAGITTLKQLSEYTEENLLELHGIGKNAVQQIKKALSDNGLSFAE